MCKVVGKLVDNESRCEHWHGPTDIIALKFKCCPQMYYPCYQCHIEVTTHPILKYDLLKDPNVKCIFCGHCQTELTFNQYTGNNLHCPNCNHQFNSGCKLHYNLYFENIPLPQQTCQL
ncbi:helper of tim [Monosporozyma unispora]|nr:helper of tim [Kazachstania unispora]